MRTATTDLTYQYAAKWLYLGHLAVIIAISLAVFAGWAVSR